MNPLFMYFKSWSETQELNLVSQETKQQLGKDYILFRSSGNVNCNLAVANQFDFGNDFRSLIEVFKQLLKVRTSDLNSQLQLLAVNSTNESVHQAKPSQN